LGVRLHDVGDAAAGQPRWPNATALGDRPEYGALGDTGGFKPRLEGGHRAGDHAARNGNDVTVPFLVGLAAAERCRRQAAECARQALLLVRTERKAP
jgi:hypothetical protein